MRAIQLASGWTWPLCFKQQSSSALRIMPLLQDPSLHVQKDIHWKAQELHDIGNLKTHASVEEGYQTIHEETKMNKEYTL